MPGKQQRTIESHLDAAERDGTWLIPATKAEVAAIQRMRDEGAVIETMPGCYARTGFAASLNPRRKALADIRSLSRIHPDWIFCGPSAAILLGLQVPQSLLGEIHILAPTTYRVAIRGVRRHLWDGANGEVVRTRGALCTSVRRTLLDCLCHADFRHGLPIVDSALHWNFVSKHELEEYFGEVGKGRRGIRQARETLHYADGRSDNGGESIVRAIIIELGFVAPELAVEVFDPMEPNNSKIADYGWTSDDGCPILGELDGLEKYRSRYDGSAAMDDETLRAFHDERLRESHLSLSGARIVRFSFEQALDEEYFYKLLSEAGVPRAG